MKRRDFLKQNGELWLYSILFGKIALSCTKESIGKNKTISHDIKGVYELVQISFNGGCINNDKYSFMFPILKLYLFAYIFDNIIHYAALLTSANAKLQSSMLSKVLTYSSISP